MRWLLTAWGSLGDLHPFLAMGRGLLARGNEVSLVGNPDWKDETEKAGLRFIASGEEPAADYIRQHPEVMTTRWHKLIIRTLPQTCRVLIDAAAQHDVIVAHHFILGAPIAAELTGTPWATVSLAPSVVPSAYLTPTGVYSPMQESMSPRLRNRVMWNFRRSAARWIVDPQINRLRRHYGLKPAQDVVYGYHSPDLYLQLYSRHFSPALPDWSREKKQAGFCFYDPPGNDLLSPELENFLQAGEPPVLFTLGSTVVRRPGRFFPSAVETLQNLGLRGVLLIGPEKNRPPQLPETILAVRYAPYGPLMSRVSAVFHQCGIGTVSHALRAGVPSIAHPFAFDQPNNARRLEALGVAEVLLPYQRSSRHMTRSLERLLSGNAPMQARKLGEAIRAEDGVGIACTLLQETFGPGHPRTLSPE